MLHLFWLQTTSRNAFLEKWMFGCYWKLSQTKNVFSVDCKIRATGCKIFSVVIFTSNHFRRRAKRERGRERRTHKHTNRERDRAVEPTIVPVRSSSSSSPRDGECSVHPSTTEIAHQHPSTGEIDPHPRALIPPPWALIHIHELRSLLHELRSIWPTHARSLSFTIYLSLSLTCRSLSLPPSLCLTEFSVLTNVLFYFLFGFVLIFVCFKFIYWNFLL